MASLSSFFSRDLLKAAIHKEEKILQKSEQVLAGLHSRRSHQEGTCRQAQKDLQQFRSEKRAKINKLDVVVALKRDQLPMPVENYEV